MDFYGSFSYLLPQFRFRKKNNKYPQKVYLQRRKTSPHRYGITIKWTVWLSMCCKSRSFRVLKWGVLESKTGRLGIQDNLFRKRFEPYRSATAWCGAWPCCCTRNYFSLYNMWLPLSGATYLPLTALSIFIFTSRIQTRQSQCTSHWRW